MWNWTHLFLECGAIIHIKNTPIYIVHVCHMYRNTKYNQLNYFVFRRCTNQYMFPLVCGSKSYFHFSPVSSCIGHVNNDLRQSCYWYQTNLLFIFFKIKTTYLDGKPVTDGAIRIQVFRRNFGTAQRQRLLWKTYSVKNGLISVVVKNVPLLTKMLYFNVSLIAVITCRCCFS